MNKYLLSILESEKDYYTNSDLIIAMPWAASGDMSPFCDIWKVNINKISNDSGLLYECRIYKNEKRVTDYGTASGNTAMIITAEEVLLRDLVIGQKLDIRLASDRSKYSARFPHGYMPIEEYYL